jgi:hypothetical protein
VEPWGASVEGLPCDLLPYKNPSRTWWTHINWFGDIVQLEDGTWLSTISMRFTGDVLASTVAVASSDEGRRWRYRSTIAGADDVPGDPSEGFDEPCLLRLDSGELLCVSRVGGKGPEPLARCYSHDDGHTWSSIDRLEAYSVAPQLCKLQDGTLLLSTGRPGIFLWCSVDPRGEHWQSVDLISHHNAITESWPMTPAQTTAYTALLEVAPNHAFLVYDRAPFGWKPVSPDSGERSQIWLVEVKTGRT